MIFNKIFLVLILLSCFVMSVMGAEDPLNKTDVNGNMVPANIVPAGTGQHTTNNEIQKSNTSGGLFDIDTSNYDIVDLLINPAVAMQIFRQITPLAIGSVIASSVVMTGVIIIVVLGFFICLGKVGIGSLHWDVKKGWKMIEHNKAAMVVLFLAVCGTFLFSSLTVFMYKFGFKLLGGL